MSITTGGNRRLNVSDTSAVWISNEDSPAVDDDGVWALNTECMFPCWLLLVPLFWKLFLCIQPGAGRQWLVPYFPDIWKV